MAPARTALLALLLLLAGCVHVEETLVFRGDGSGTGRLAITGRDSVLADLRRKAGAPGAPALDAVEAIFDAAKAREQVFAAEGFRIDDLSVTAGDGVRTLDVAFTFASLDTLLATAFFAEQLIEFVEGAAPDTARFRFSPLGPTRDPTTGLQDLPSELHSAYEEAVAAMFRAGRVAVRITLPGAAGTADPARLETVFDGAPVRTLTDASRLAEPRTADFSARDLRIPLLPREAPESSPESRRNGHR